MTWVALPSCWPPGAFVHFGTGSLVVDDVPVPGVSPPDEGDVLDPPDEGDVLDPPDEGDVLDPPDEGDVLDPPDEGTSRSSNEDVPIQ